MNTFSATVRATRKESVEVDVLVRDMYEAIEHAVNKEVVLRPGQWIDAGFIYEEHHTSHSYTHKVGPATESQLEAYDALSTIRRILKSGNHM